MATANLVSVVIPVFEDGLRAAQAVEAVLAQELPEPHTLEVIIVNDGSRPTTVQALEYYRSRDHVRVIDLPLNEGRSSARNRGAGDAMGEYLLFIDCDCVPLTQAFIANHLKALERGAVASCGDVQGPDATFWSRYQQEASDRRRRSFVNGKSYVGTSQNMAVQRDAFLAIGGFESGYRQYGFEDRDLLIRLANNGMIAWCTDTIVVHCDHLSLPAVLSKLWEAGAFGAAKFRNRHPDEYRGLGYGAVDVHTGGLFARLASWLGKPSIRLAPRIDRLISSGRVPFALSSRFVRIASAASFSLGTREARRCD